MFDAILPVNFTGTYERKRDINNADTPERWFPMYLETNTDDLRHVSGVNSRIS